MAKMNFFSDAWAASENDDAVESVRRSYMAALQSIPGDVGRKADEISRLDLRTALIDKIVQRARQHEIEIHLISGDNATGYSLL